MRNVSLDIGHEIFNALPQAANELRRRRLLRFVADSVSGQYQAGWVHDLICRRLEQFSSDVAAGKSPRLMLAMPPRHGKTFIASERFPVWHLGRNPNHEIIVCSYSSDLAQQSSRRALSLSSSEYVANVFPQLKIAKNGVEKWETSRGGGFRPAGVGQGITGQGAHVLIIDDPVKDWQEALSETRRKTVWEWYGSTAYTRLAPGGGVLIIQTRWHQDDLSGKLINAQKLGLGDTWDILSFPAIAECDEDHRLYGGALHPQRWPLDALERIKIAIGTKAWGALYQQKPSEEEGSELKRAWFKFYDIPPSSFDEEIISVDAAFKETKDSDYVSIQTWGKTGPNYYLIENLTKRLGFWDSLAAIRAARIKHPKAKIIIEDKANGPAITETLRREISGVIVVNPEGGKTARVRAIAGIVEGGNVYVPKYAPWTESFINECAAFPSGANDDQVDSMSQALLKFQINVKTQFGYLKI